MTVIPQVVGALGMVHNDLEKSKELEMEGIFQTIQTTALWKSTKLLSNVLEIREDLLSLRINEKLPVKVVEEKPARLKIIIMNLKNTRK